MNKLGAVGWACTDIASFIFLWTKSPLSQPYSVKECFETQSRACFTYHMAPFPGCAGWVAELPEVLALPGAHLQLWGHQSPAARGVQALPDHGAHLAQSHEERQGEPPGEGAVASLFLHVGVKRYLCDCWTCSTATFSCTFRSCFLCDGVWLVLRWPCAVGRVLKSGW